MRRWLLYALLVVQAAGIACLYLWNARAANAPAYLLKVRPVDPRDLLRGDFIILSYDIGRLPDSIPDESKLPEHVWVTLRPNGRFLEIAAVEESPPGGDEIYLRATRRGRQLIYDLEHYYVPEGRGNPQGEMEVEVAIRNGRGIIRRLYVNGEPWK